MFEDAGAPRSGDEGYGRVEFGYEMLYLALTQLEFDMHYYVLGDLDEEANPIVDLIRTMEATQ